MYLSSRNDIGEEPVILWVLLRLKLHLITQLPAGSCYEYIRRPTPLPLPIMEGSRDY